MSRRVVLTLLRAAALVTVLLFAAYWVCVQINAIAYLVGKRSAIIRGVMPPVPVRSDAVAAVDIVIGLVYEAIAAVINSVDRGCGCACKAQDSQAAVSETPFAELVCTVLMRRPRGADRRQSVPVHRAGAICDARWSGR